MLSVSVLTVRSRQSLCWARMSKWAICPASSRSEFVIAPCGLAVETRSDWIGNGKVCRQTSGLNVGSPESQTPPMPAPLASAAPMATGRSGTISPRRVGREPRSRARWCRSEIASRIGWLRRMRCLSGWLKPVCSVLKNPCPPGTAKIILRSSPKALCQSLSETRRRSLRPSNISKRRNRRCSGSSIVSATESTIQPRRTFRVAHFASPFANLLSEIGSLRCLESVGQFGRKTSSMEWNIVERTRSRSPGWPCASPRKSSM